MLIKLSATSRNEVTINESIAVDINDITTPITRPVATSIVNVRESKKNRESESRQVVEYGISEDLDAISALSGDALFKVTVTSEDGRDRGTQETLFFKERIAGKIEDEGTGSKFLYEIDGVINPVEFFTVEDVDTILAIIGPGGLILGGSLDNIEVPEQDIQSIKVGPGADDDARTEVIAGKTTLILNDPTPVVTSFAVDGANLLEVGDTRAAGNFTFTWSTDNDPNVQGDIVDILDVTNATNLVIGTDNDGTELLALPLETRVINAIQQYKIQGLDKKAKVFDETLDIEWQWLQFFGKDANAGPLLEAEVEALPNSGLSDTTSGTYAFLAGAGYLYFAFPSSLAAPTSFKDQATGIDVAMQASVVVNLTNAFGVAEDYNVFRSTNVLNGAITVNVS